MKKTFAMILPLVGIFSILAVQQVAVKSVKPIKDTVVLSLPIVTDSNIAVDSSSYVGQEDMGKIRDEYKYVAKGGLEKAKVRGDVVLSELDSYLLRLDEQIKAKKKLAESKEEELRSLPSPKARKPPSVKKTPPVEYGDDENY